MASYFSSYSYQTNLGDKGVSKDVYDKLGALSVSEGALTEFNTSFTIGPTENEFVTEYAYGEGAHTFHYLDYTSTDIIVIRQSMMLAFFIMTQEMTKTIEPISRSVKDILLKPSKVSI